MNSGKTNCIIIHGCPSKREEMMNLADRTFDKHWMPWIREKLEAQGTGGEIPMMPTPWEPVYEDYKKEFEKYTINENTVLIGHSCGCSFLVRWLGETKKKISKLILVAPWKIASDASELEKAFYEFPIDESIKDRVEKIVFFTSNNEEHDGKEGLKMFHGAIGGQIINLEGRGHYVMRHMGTYEFPELLKVILEKRHSFGSFIGK